MALMTEAEKLAQRRRISREIDQETARRMELAGFPRHQPREPEPKPEPVLQAAAPRPPAAAAMTPEGSAPWNRWVNTMIDQRLSTGVIPAVGIALAKKAKELRDEMAALADGIGSVTSEATRRIMALEAEVAERLQEQVADAVRDYSIGASAPLRAEIEELRARLATAEARLAAATGERTAPLALPGPGWVGRA